MLVILCLIGQARGQGNMTGDQEIAQAIARGVEFLKGEQSDRGEWIEPAQNQHPLGMTALAGLALLENGVARDARDQQGSRDRHDPRARVRIDLRSGAGDLVPRALLSKRERVTPTR